jgi:hypothetical protein
VEAIHERDNSLLHTFPTNTEQNLKAGLDFISHEVNAVMTSYKNVYDRSQSLEITLNPIGGTMSMPAAYRKLIIECDSLIEYLNTTISPLIVREKGVLEKIQEESKELLNKFDAKFEMNLNLARLRRAFLINLHLEKDMKQ